jgi:hypothetical protein
LPAVNAANSLSGTPMLTSLYRLTSLLARAGSGQQRPDQGDDSPFAVGEHERGRLQVRNPAAAPFGVGTAHQLVHLGG